MLYLAVILFFALTAPLLAQAEVCVPTPAAPDATAMRSCAVERRGDLGQGISWELQSRIYRAPRPGSGDMTLRMMVVRERGAVVAWTEPSYGEPQRPERLATPRGLLLRLPVTPVSGGTTPLDEVWMRQEPLHNWVHLDARAWRTEAEARLAPGEALAPAWQLQISPLRATGGVTREGDPPGQASRGSYTAWLDLGEDRLVLVGFSRN